MPQHPCSAASCAPPWQVLRYIGRLLLGWIILLLLGATGAQAAQSRLDLGGVAATGAVVQMPEVRAELVAFAPQGIGPGRLLELGLLLQHQAGWHTYWVNPGDSGLPTELQWRLPKGLLAGSVQWPTPAKITIGRLANFGYEGRVLLPVKVQITPDFHPAPSARALEVQLSASWLVCQKECIPQQGEFVLEVPLQGSTALNKAAFEAADAALARPLKGSLRAEFDGGDMLLHAEGLPAHWHGKALRVFPEAPAVFATDSGPWDTDTTVTDLAPTAQKQAWHGAVWSARLPLSPQRTTGPQQISFLFALGDQSVQGHADITGVWPATPPRASPAQSAVETPAAGPNRTVAPAGDAKPQSMAWALAAAFIGGLILNLMPCVFPVLAIKVLGFSTQAKPGAIAPPMVGLAYTAGVLVSMLALGGALLALRATGEQLGWGFQLQSPAVVTALAVLFTLIGLNLLDVLEFGSLVPSTLAGLQLRHPAADAALSGVLAVAVASPCTAPFMGASLGLALTLPPWQAIGIFLSLGLGLAAPFAVVSSLPHAARWMPRPGTWMVNLRQFMAFPMAATVLWLLWVLGHLGGLDAAAALAALLLGLVLTVWSLQLPGRSRWGFFGAALLLLLVLMRTLGPLVLQTQTASSAAVSSFESENTNTAVSETTVGQWNTWSAQRVQSELAQGNRVFVDFTAAWCITCQYNKQATLSASEVLRDFSAKHVTLLRADWTRRDPTITQALAALGRSGVPVYVLYRNGNPPVVMSEIITIGELRAALAAL